MGYDLDLNPSTIRTYHRRLMILGFKKEEADNLIAKLVGLDIGDRAWTVDEIIHVIFISKLGIDS